MNDCSFTVPSRFQRRASHLIRGHSGVPDGQAALGRALLSVFGAIVIALVLGGCGGDRRGDGDDDRDDADAVAVVASEPDPNSLGGLAWGNDPRTGAAWTAAGVRARLVKGDDPVGRAARSVLRKAELALTDDVVPVNRLQMDAQLFGSPEYQASDRAVRSLDEVFSWSICARVATAELAPRCFTKARDAVLAWVRTYVPSGNPVDEANLYYFLLAVDVMRAAMTWPDREEVNAWLARLDRAAERFEARLGAADTARLNNRHTWKLANVALAAAVRGDADALKHIADELVLHAGSNVDGDGATYDFHQRDALHYQVYALEAYMRMAAFAPRAAEGARDATIRALVFLRPYYLGVKTHTEFVGTTVEMDLKRKAAGEPDWQNEPWEAQNARPMLRLARAVFDEVRGWTGDLAGQDSFHPALKLICALKGDP